MWVFVKYSLDIDTPLGLSTPAMVVVISSNINMYEKLVFHAKLLLNRGNILMRFFWMADMSEIAEWRPLIGPSGGSPVLGIPIVWVFFL